MCFLFYLDQELFFLQNVNKSRNPLTNHKRRSISGFGEINQYFRYNLGFIFSKRLCWSLLLGKQKNPCHLCSNAGRSIIFFCIRKHTSSALCHLVINNVSGAEDVIEFIFSEYFHFFYSIGEINRNKRENFNQMFMLLMCVILWMLKIIFFIIYWSE